MAGYSETPLVKKLGIKAGFNIALVNAPVGFFDELTLATGRYSQLTIKEAARICTFVC